MRADFTSLIMASEIHLSAKHEALGRFVHRKKCCSKTLKQCGQRFKTFYNLGTGCCANSPTLESESALSLGSLGFNCIFTDNGSKLIVLRLLARSDWLRPSLSVKVSCTMEGGSPGR